MFSELAPMARSLVLLAVVLSPADLERLEKYGAAWALSPDEARAPAAQARADFAGRGTEIATHFLLHTNAPPGNGAYFFVLRAVGDPDTALTLIRALSNPPPRESGLLDRDFGEVAVAIEAVLAGGTARGDPRVAAALEEAVGTARRKPYGDGTGDALEAVRLIGMCSSSAAAHALARFAADDDPAIRAAAAAALGELAPTAHAVGVDPVSPARELLRILSADPSPLARREAAESLGSIEAPEVVPGLRDALRTEPDPRVVDTVVQSLGRRGAPPEDPAQCRGLIGRMWEARLAEQMLDCWRRSGVRSEQLEHMALTGGATERAVALFAVSKPPVQTQSLVVSRAAEPVHFDPLLRARLLEAAVWVLSRNENIALSTRERAAQALWNLSALNMDRALEYADRVTPVHARFRASEALARADAAGYDATRRRQQAAVAAVIALGFGLLAACHWRLARPAVLVGASMVGWAAWTLQASGVRDLPPPPLRFLSVAAIAFLSAGATAGTLSLIAGRPPGGAGPIVRRAVLMMLTSGVVAGAICDVTRYARLFPMVMSGWELIFDPLAATILAMAVAAMLVLVERLLPWRAS